jgi:hypothetical protein
VAVKTQTRNQGLIEEVRLNQTAFKGDKLRPPLSSRVVFFRKEREKISTLQLDSGYSLTKLQLTVNL